MSLRTHGDQKYRTSESLGRVAEWDAMRVEHRHLAAGAQNGLTPECAEFVYILSGKARVRRTGDGQRQEGIARPGTSWLVPAGTHETLLELDDASECLHVFLPATLLDGSALAAHLIGHYTIDRWRPPTRAPSLDAKRLKRVLEFIEARLAEDISLGDLAAEACLSPFHFLRLFREATGLSPHRYLTSRRIRLAQTMLACRHASLVQVALDCGFSSQASFTRVFRKLTGLTPGRYRARCPR